MDFNISTITMSIISSKHLNLNLLNISKYLDIDDNIIGIKYNYDKNKSILKGEYLNSKLKSNGFYNQISFILRLDLVEKNKFIRINLKLFKNGSIQITGLKQTNILICKKIVKFIFDKLNNLKNKNQKILLSLSINNIYTDNDDFVYSVSEPFKILGNINENKICIEKKYYIIENTPFGNCFISYDFENKKRNILDLNGNLIGYIKYNLLQKKLYMKNSNISFANNFIYYDTFDKSKILGEKQYIWTSKPHNFDLLKKNILEINYNCKENINNINADDFEYRINCINITFNLKSTIYKETLFNNLLKQNYLVEYNPEIYTGLKFIFKINQKEYHQKQFLGKCICNNKCTCENITFLIFNTGKIIGTGFKNTFFIPDILSSFKKIILSK